jgi:ABC-type nickel/cobalt efflux system permease component RcnA
MSMRRIQWKPVDIVALVLAISLGIAIILIMVAVLENVHTKRTPTPTLGENTAQVLIAVVGGVVGVLGSYIGFRVGKHEDSADGHVAHDIEVQRTP